MEPAPEVSCSETYLSVLVQGFIQLHLGKYEAAEKLFRTGQVLGPSAQAEAGCDIVPLALYCLSLLRLRQGRREESGQLREVATARLEKTSITWDSWWFHNLTATVLADLGEFHRAIPFCEKAIQLKLDADPIPMAEMLKRLGECYTRSGLRDHATAPLRAAVKIFRNCPGDPRLAAVLITLGNALRKDCPAEAESCYREVAELHMAKGQVESATVAWVNLGVLCSEQGRYEESIDYYQRVLRVRETTMGTPVDSLARVLNNIANCYRRMKKFEQALHSVDRAIALLEPAGASSVLAYACGTRGLIFLDTGRDEDAVEWLDKSYLINQQIPSANLEVVAEDLEKQIAALQRLGRTGEENLATGRLEQVRAKISSVKSSGQNFSALQTTPTREAVLIEIPLGTRFANQERRNTCTRLIYRLSEVIETQQVGHIGGEVIIPENTTLIFYGPDAEALYRAMEPVLAGDPASLGATVTIRRPDSLRTVTLTGTVN